MKQFIITIVCSIYSFITSPFAAWRWSRRNVADGYFKTMNLPMNPYIMSFIDDLVPHRTILEVGCSSGCHLVLLHEKLPVSTLYGIDICKRSVDFGNLQLKKLDINNAHIEHLAADNISTFPDNSIDIVFSQAVLTHITPATIEKVMQEMFRISRKWVVIAAPQLYLKQKTKLLPYYHFQWLRDYVGIINKLHLGKIVQSIKIPPELWPGEPWASLGRIIIVEKY